MNRSALMTGLLMLSCIASAEDRVTIAETMPYADGIGLVDVRKECDWNIQFNFHLSEFAKPLVEISSVDIDRTKGKVLSMTVVNMDSLNSLRDPPYTLSKWITHLHPKWVTIRGELLEAGNTIGSFHITRTTNIQGGNACATLDRIGERIAKDISGWLKAPSMDTKIGSPPEPGNCNPLSGLCY